MQNSLLQDMAYWNHDCEGISCFCKSLYRSFFKPKSSNQGGHEWSLLTRDVTQPRHIHRQCSLAELFSSHMTWSCQRQKSIYILKENQRTGRNKSQYLYKRILLSEVSKFSCHPLYPCAKFSPTFRLSTCPSQFSTVLQKLAFWKSILVTRMRPA